MLNFQRLDVYRLSIEWLALAVKVHDDITRSKGHAGVADQLKRAALSIPINIAEGAGKATHADQSRYFVIARGSAMECSAIVDALGILELASNETRDRADELLTRIVSMLTKMSHFH
jgi:four helix bundle protein